VKLNLLKQLIENKLVEEDVHAEGLNSIILYRSFQILLPTLFCLKLVDRFLVTKETLKKRRLTIIE